MKKLQYLLSAMFLFLIGMAGVNAETIDASIKLVGRNTFGRELEIEINCNGGEEYNCYLTDAKWYYNDTNSTEGGTLIPDGDNGGTNHSNYYIAEELIGKYIYVVATIGTYNSNYETVVLTDITDAETNTTSIVDDYISYVDISDFTIETTATYQVGAQLTMQIKGLEIKDHNHFVYLSNGEEPQIKQTTSGCNIEVDDNDYSKFKTIYKDTGIINVADDWYMLKGYTYAYLAKEIYDSENGGYYCEVSKSPVEVKKPSLPALGNRYQFYIFSGTDKLISTFPLFPHYGESGSHNLITKIGLIKDKALLKKLAKNTSDSLLLLLDYAKTNEGTIYKYLDDVHDTDIGSFKVTNGAYYYIYTSYENTDGLYRDLDDVTVVMGESGMLVNDVKWDSIEDDTIDLVWENFVKAVKENELLKDNEDVTIEYDEDSMDITADTITITFNYSNGVVSFEAPEGATDAELFGYTLYQGIILEEFLNKFKYDAEDAIKYIENNPKSTIEKDGFEYVLKEIKINEESGGSSVNIDGDALTTLKLDIVNGLKNYKTNIDTPIPEEDAPQTGFWLGIGSLGLLLSISLSGIYLNNKMKKDNKIIKL